MKTILVVGDSRTKTSHPTLKYREKNRASKLWGGKPAKPSSGPGFLSQWPSLRKLQNLVRCTRGNEGQSHVTTFPLTDQCWASSEPSW